MLQNKYMCCKQLNYVKEKYMGLVESYAKEKKAKYKLSNDIEILKSQIDLEKGKLVWIKGYLDNNSIN